MQKHENSEQKQPIDDSGATINVLEVANTLGIGGTEKMLQIFCEYLDKRKFNVYACGYFAGGPRQELVAKHTKEVFVANSEPQVVIDFITTHNIKVVHWHGINANSGPTLDGILKVLRYCQENNIRTVETSPFSLYNETKDALIDTRLFVSQINLLKFFVNYSEKNLEKDRYYYMYNPIDTAELGQYKMSQEQIKTKRHYYGIHENDFVIGKVGRADLWKWDDAIFRVIPFLQKKMFNLKILVRSIPPQKLSLVNRFGGNAMVINLPETCSEKEICETYQMMDVYFHTSRIGECHSSSINEAMFFGKPVITNSTDFRKKTIFDRDNGQIEMIVNGVNGFVENDINEMAQRVLELRDNAILYKEIAENNANKANSLFNPELVTKKLERILVNPHFERGHELITLETYNKMVIPEKPLDVAAVSIKAIYEKIRYLR